MWSRLGHKLDVMLHASTFLLPPAQKPLPNYARSYALVVLNQHLPRFIPRLWSHAQLRICADGGANRIFDELPWHLVDKDSANIRMRYIPDIIEGDMDSIRPEVQQFYSSQGTKILEEPNEQDTNDLHKCIGLIQRDPPDVDKSNLCVLVTGALGGRFDHEAANINVLHTFSDMRIVLVSDDCLIQLLPKTHSHEIHIQPSVEGPHCGLFPIGSPSSSTTTTGLQWNLNDAEMRFGKTISTSNIVSEDTVTVRSDADLLWTISLRNHT